MKYRNFICLLFFIWCGCRSNTATTTTGTVVTNDWKKVLQEELPLLGHRNWILVVDKAFPALNAPGIKVLYADENLLPVLKYTLAKIDASSSVRPIIYTDKELQYLTSQQVTGINAYRDTLKTIVNQPMKSILHDSLFTSIQVTSELFKVLVIKTNETKAYSSVFLQLVCAYWDGAHEKQLRALMSDNKLSDE